MRHARATVADAQAGAALISAKENARAVIFGILISWGADQSPRLKNTTDGSEIVTFQASTLVGTPLAIFPGFALWHSAVGSGIQVDTATVDSVASGTVEVDVWYEYVDGNVDVFAI